MSESDSVSNETKPRKRWRWVKRVFAILGILLILLIAFHRPIIGWAAAYFGKKALADAGLTAEWTLSGNFYSGIQLDNVKVTGDELAQLRTATLKHLELKYDLWEIRKRGVGAIAKEVTVNEFDMELDLTRPGHPSSKPPRAEPAKESSKLPNIFIPKITITDVNLRITQPDQTLRVEDFSLSMDPAAPGIIQWKRLVLPGVPVFGPVNGVTRVTPQSLQFDNLALTASTLVESVYADISKLPEETAPVRISVRQGASQIKIDGIASAWMSSPEADANVNITNLADGDLRYWSVPLGPVNWVVPSLNLQAKGPVLKPAELNFAFDLAAAPVDVPGLKINNAAVKVSSSKGALKIESLTGNIGGNSISATATASLPPEWADIGNAPGKLQFKATAAELEKFTDQVSGAVTAQGDVTFGNLELKGANVAAQSTQLKVSGVSVQSVDLLATTTGQTVTLEKAVVKMNDQNVLNATGKIDLTGDMLFEANWHADCADISTVPVDLHGDSVWPESGTVKTIGSAKASVAMFQNKAWQEMAATADIQAANVKLKEASLQTMSLKANLAKGLVNLDNLDVIFDEQNSIHAAGNIDIQKSEIPLTAKATITLPAIEKLSAWSESFKGPKLEQGSALVSWDATGQINPLLINGTGNVDVSGVKLDIMPEVIGLKASVTQADADIDVKTLAASVGPWRAEGRAKFDGARLTIPELKGWLKDQPLLQLSASAPVKFREEPLELKLNIDKLDTGKLAAALGQKFPANGVVSARADFHGTLANLEGALNADVVQIKVDQKEAASLEPGSVKLNIALGDGKVNVTSTIIQKPLQPLTVKASAPLNIPNLMEQPSLAEQLPITAEAHLPSSNLNFLPKFVPAIHEITGTAGLDVTVSGTVSQPKIKGLVTASVPEAIFTAGNLPSLKDVNVRIRADDRKITIENASLLLSGGNLKLTGGSDLTNVADPTLDLRVNAEEILVVRDDTISLRANANIACEGKLSKALVKGNIDLVRGRVFKEIEFLPLSLPNQLPPPPASTTLGKSGPPSLPAPLDKWDFDVGIRTKDPIRLLGNVAHGGAVADLKLVGTGANPELTGMVKLEESWVKLPFSRLNLTQAEILFLKDKPFDPQIQMLGESIVGNYMVTLNVTGRALDPKLRFTSSPPLPEGDIASLLATGTTTNDLQSGNGEAAGRAIFLVVQSAYRKLFPKLSDSLEEAEPPRLTFELTGFGTNSGGVSAVYEINKKVKAIGRVGQAGTFRGLLYYLIRFR